MLLCMNREAAEASGSGQLGQELSALSRHQVPGNERKLARKHVQHAENSSPNYPHLIVLLTRVLLSLCIQLNYFI